MTSPDAFGALLALFRPEPPPGVEGWNEARWRPVLELAGSYRLGNALRWRLACHGLLDTVPAAVRDYVEGTAELAALRAEEQLRHSLRIAAVLGEAGVAPVFLKGAAAHLTRLYPDAGARLCSDIDVLVAADALDAAADALRARGYTPSPLAAVQPSRHHYPLLLHPDECSGVELHFRLHGRRYADVLPPAALLADTVAVDHAGQRLRVPSPAHRLVHAVVHFLADYRHGMQLPLRHLVEIATLAPTAAEWQALSACFERAGLVADLRQCLVLADVLIGLPPPEAIARERGYAAARARTVRAYATRRALRPRALLARRVLALYQDLGAREVAAMALAPGKWRRVGTLFRRHAAAAREAGTASAEAIDTG